LPLQVLRRGQPTLLPVIKQYRPPIANYCLELPAGLVRHPAAAAVLRLHNLRWQARRCMIAKTQLSNPANLGGTTRAV
jgi:hypothetical protein